MSNNNKINKIIKTNEQVASAKENVLDELKNVVEEQPVEKAPESKITEVPEQIAGAVVDTFQEVGNTIAGLGNIADEKLSLRDLSATIREKTNG